MAAPNDKTKAVSAHPVVSADAAIARAANRLSTLYLMRTLRLIAFDADGDLITAIVFHGVLAANVGHLDSDPNQPSPFNSIENLPPQEVRRSVSILGLAESLGLPYETTRRHVNKLVRTGRCLRVKGGVILGDAGRGPEEDSRILANFVNLRRMYRALKAMGADLD